MKQNERLLVYAVTGFLGLILIIAVVFGESPTPQNDQQEQRGGQSLGDILDGKEAEQGKDDAAANAGETTLSGVQTPTEIASNKGPEQPLVARPQLARDLVRNQLGQSRRDRTVRFVRARRGDSLESLVRRWCGSRNPYYEEARYLNEDLTMLREGQEVGVPWVDDEVLAAILEAQRVQPTVGAPAASNGAPRTLVTDGGAAGRSTGGDPGNGTPMPASSRPSFAMPGSQPSNASISNGGASNGSTPVAAVGKEYTVKSGDALWSIAAKHFGRGNADKMVRAIKDLNPGLTDRLQIGQKIALPAN